MVELPLVACRCPGRYAWCDSEPRNAWTHRPGEPSVLIDTAASHNVEKLGVLAFCGLRIVKGVDEADAGDGVLCHSVDRARGRNVEDFVDGRGNIVDVKELRTRRGDRPRYF